MLKQQLSSSNLNNNLFDSIAFDTNVANAFTLALTNLNTTLTSEGKKNKTVNYLTFSRRGDKDINNFISELKKTFAVNR